MACRTSNTVDFHPCTCKLKGEHDPTMLRKMTSLCPHWEMRPIRFASSLERPGALTWPHPCPHTNRCLIPWKTQSTHPIPAHRCLIPWKTQSTDPTPAHLSTGASSLERPRVLTPPLPPYLQVPHPLKDPEYWPHPCPPIYRCLIPWKTQSNDPTPAPLSTGASSLERPRVLTPPLPPYLQVPHPLKDPEYWPHPCPPTNRCLFQVVNMLNIPLMYWSSHDCEEFPSHWFKESNRK